MEMKRERGGGSEERPVGEDPVRRKRRGRFHEEKTTSESWRGAMETVIVEDQPIKAYPVSLAALFPLS